MHSTQYYLPYYPKSGNSFISRFLRTDVAVEIEQPNRTIHEAAIWQA